MFGYSGIDQLLIASVAILISIILHELAHGYVALWNGDATAKFYGRLSLDPRKHFDPIGLVMLLLVRFGYAKPVPINPDNFRHRKLGLITVSGAGVALNLILAFISTPLFMLCMYSSSKLVFYIGEFFYWMMIINVNLALFNLLPIYPLDGFNLIASFTRAINPVTRFLRTYGQYILIILIGLGIIVDYTGLPVWVDILGYYIGNVGGWILNGFIKFWGLIF